MYFNDLGNDIFPLLEALGTKKPLSLYPFCQDMRGKSLRYARQNESKIGLKSNEKSIKIHKSK